MHHDWWGWAKNDVVWGLVVVANRWYNHILNRTSAHLHYPCKRKQKKSEWNAASSTKNPVACVWVLRVANGSNRHSLQQMRARTLTENGILRGQISLLLRLSKVQDFWRVAVERIELNQNVHIVAGIHPMLSADFLNSGSSKYVWTYQEVFARSCLLYFFTHCRGHCLVKMKMLPPRRVIDCHNQSRLNRVLENHSVTRSQDKILVIVVVLEMKFSCTWVGYYLNIIISSQIVLEWVFFLYRSY